MTENRENGVNAKTEVGSPLELLDVPREGVERKQDVLYRQTVDRFGKPFEKFELQKQIGGLNYNFVFFPRALHDYGISFKTAEYDYALTELRPEDLDTIILTVKNMVETANTPRPIIQRIEIDPAHHAYSMSEIEACKQVLLEHAVANKNDLDQMEGFQILDKYAEVMGEDFPLKRKKYETMIARGRFFRIYLKKYFPDWKFEQLAGLPGFSMTAPEA